MTDAGFNTRSFLLWIAVIIGVILGITVALLWIFDSFPIVSLTIPYAWVIGLIIFAATPLMAVLLRGDQSGPCEHGAKPVLCIDDFIRIIMIAAAVFLFFVLFYIGGALTYAGKVLFSFIGGISFLVMLFAFVGFVISLFPRRPPRFNCRC